MRTACLRILALSVVLIAAWSGPRPAQAQVFCFIVDQQCVACGPTLIKKCTYRECTDGTRQTSCTGCGFTCVLS